MNLIQQYENTCNAIVAAFCEKQEATFCGWVGNRVGQVAVFSTQYFFDFWDVVHDLKTNQPKNAIFAWHRNEEFAQIQDPNAKKINYQSYCMGYRHNTITDETISEFFESDPFGE